jgi:class 3 adenylate cyclase
MFCDLVGSTALSTQLDPEELREIISSYHKRCAEVIAKSGGFVARYLGDGVLAYFGYPQAHENDAERAVRAGLALVAAIPNLDVGKRPALRVRVGIATGLVVVGDLVGEGSSQEQAVVGETPNLAARLQALSEPDTVVISGSTRRLLGALFEYRTLRSMDVKGFSQPVEVWQVIGTSTIDSRFEALRGTMTPLVDREEEIDLLMRRWEEAKRGNGCIVLICGEPGIGKSRIVQTVLESSLCRITIDTDRGPLSSPQPDAAETQAESVSRHDCADRRARRPATRAGGERRHPMDRSLLPRTPRHEY